MPEYISRIISRFRRLILFMMDSMLVCIAYLATWMLISGRASIMDDYYSMMISSCFLFVACYSIVYYATGMYDSLWRYAEIIEFFRCAASSLIAVAAFGIISSIIYTERRIPYSVFGRSAAFASSLTLYTRLTYRMYRNTKISAMGKKRQRVLLVGAGDAASTLIHELNKSL